MKNNPLLVFGLIALGLALMSFTGAKATFFRRPMRRRGTDGQGSGEFGASREQGKRSHNGLDILADVGEVVYTPFAAKVVRLVDPYGDGRYGGLLLQTEGPLILKVMYINPYNIVGQTIQAGTPIGTVQNIVAKYGAGMTNHIHVEAYKNGSLIDPTPIFF